MRNIIEAIRAIYPNIQGGFVYWETKADGSEWECPIDGLVWENAEFTKPSWGQITDKLLDLNFENAKIKKIAEIKSIRDAKNVESIVDTKAPLLDEDGLITDKNTYFTFYTKRHPTNPAADPNSVLTSAIVSDQHVPYSTKSPEGVKIVVALTPEIARVLVAHISLRNNNNYKLSDAIEAAVKAATTKEEVEAITWDLKYLN